MVDLKDNFLWKHYKILPDGVYDITCVDENRFVAIVLNFDSNQFVFETLEGIRIEERRNIKRMVLTKTMVKTFEEEQRQRVKEIIEIINRPKCASCKHTDSHGICNCFKLCTNNSEYIPKMRIITKGTF